jgi:GNAT superfamily N-acetyltransferase
MTPWAQFQKNFESSSYRPEGEHIAAVGDVWVGLGAVGYFAEHQVAHHMITGVRRAYRGRGIAQALKVLTIRRGREWGALRMRTNNDSKNAPMLAINRKLGFQAQPGFYKLIKAL